eukprot:7510990-Pyramimonas_sp.AAC.1
MSEERKSSSSNSPSLPGLAFLDSFQLCDPASSYTSTMWPPPGRTIRGSMWDDKGSTRAP